MPAPDAEPSKESCTHVDTMRCVSPVARLGDNTACLHIDTRYGEILANKTC